VAKPSSARRLHGRRVYRQPTQHRRDRQGVLSVSTVSNNALVFLIILVVGKRPFIKVSKATKWP
jgi:hypothetical protein